MKKTMAVICALSVLLCAGYAFAQNGMDYLSYMVRSSRYVNRCVMLDEHNIAAECWETREGYSEQKRFLTWWRDGQAYREIEYAWDEPDLTLLPREDGTCAVLSIGENGIRLYAWEDAGLENERTLSEQWRCYYLAGRGVAVTAGEGEAARLRLYDAYGNEEADIPVPTDGPAFLITGALRDQNGLWLAAGCPEGQGERHLLLCVRDGKILWQKDTGEQAYRLQSDGQGGFFTLLTVGLGTYPALEITHYDQQGRHLGKRILRGDKVLVGCAIRFDPTSGGYVLWGKAVAGSRGVFDVFRMETDGEMNMKALDVRKFNFENQLDYGLFTPDAERAFVYLRLDGYDDYALLAVPYRDLPGAGNPGLTLL